MLLQEHDKTKKTYQVELPPVLLLWGDSAADIRTTGARMLCVS